MNKDYLKAIIAITVVLLSLKYRKVFFKKLPVMGLKLYLLAFILLVGVVLAYNQFGDRINSTVLTYILFGILVLTYFGGALIDNIYLLIY